MLVYNTKTHKKEALVPSVPGKISMYVCGPTVYDDIHIGNARTFLSFDVIRRYLIYKGYQVTFAQNLTDIDDKIINRAHELGKTPEELAQEYSNAFIAIMHKLNVLDPDIRPRATREIPAMISMITDLINNGSAYVASNNDVYFSVRSCETYGEVSNRNIDDLQVGARVEENSAKKDPLDFVLWKASKPGEPSWESPWGPGRPGWHTECCAMIKQYLGIPIDIHGGGSDLVFPHHENEDAQCSCAFHASLAHVWMHAGMLKINGEKMSKSLGNFYTLKEVLDQFSGDVVRLLMLQTHYRSPLDFSFDRLTALQTTLEKVKTCVKNLRWSAKQAQNTCAKHLSDTDHNLACAIDACMNQFTESMDDDFNTAGALGAVFVLINAANSYLDDPKNSPACAVALRCADAIQELMDVLGIDVQAQEEALPYELVGLANALCEYEGTDVAKAAEAILAYRAEARAQKNWALADAIRDGIQKLGLVLEDTAQGTRITQK